MIVLKLVQGLAKRFPEFLKLTGRHAGNLFELIGEVLHTAIAKFMSDLTRVQFIIHQQLLCSFYPLENRVALNGQE